jgi:hypothetical protein
MIITITCTTTINSKQLINTDHPYLLSSNVMPGQRSQLSLPHKAFEILLPTISIV